MGVSAIRRGDTVIARQSAKRYSVAEVQLLTRERDHQIAQLAHTNADQQQEIDDLKAQVASLEAAREENLRLSGDLARAKTMQEHYHTLWLAEKERREVAERSHAKLSAIVRLIPAAAYHRARDIHNQYTLGETQ